MLPVLCWLGVSFLLFVSQFHRTQAGRAAIHFRVAAEGREGKFFHEATINGLPYQPGEPCGVGWKKLVVRAENAEPFETNCFVWYGGEAFGKITLARTRGRMELDFSPAVESVRIAGSEERTNLNKVTRNSLFLPTGRYAVEVRFARFSVERTVDVTRNETTRVAITQSLTTLNLSSEPEKAEFELNSKVAPKVFVRGETPASVTDLPAGEYELTMARDDYRKNLSVQLAAVKATNELKVEFRYANVSVTSLPSEATVSVNGRSIGPTPVNVELKPGSYGLSIAKEGYLETNVDLTLLESESRTVSVTLGNVAFEEAIERARQFSLGGRDYDRALSAVETALRIKPDNAGALALQRTIQFDRHLWNARQFERKREFPQALFEADAALKLNANDSDALALKAELEKGQRAEDEQRVKAKESAAAKRIEARRGHPEKVLEETARYLRDPQLFANHTLRFPGSIDAVRERVLRIFDRKSAWILLRDHKHDPDTIVLMAEAKGAGSKQNVVLVIGQVADNEVAVCFKLFAFVGADPQTPGGSSYRPSTLERDLNTQEFKKRIEEELR